MWIEVDIYDFSSQSWEQQSLYFGTGGIVMFRRCKENSSRTRLFSESDLSNERLGVLCKQTIEEFKPLFG